MLLIAGVSSSSSLAALRKQQQLRALLEAAQEVTDESSQASNAVVEMLDHNRYDLFTRINSRMSLTSKLPILLFDLITDPQGYRSILTLQVETVTGKITECCWSLPQVEVVLACPSQS